MRHGETAGQSSIRYFGATDVPLSDLVARRSRGAGALVAGEASKSCGRARSSRAAESAHILAPGRSIRLEADFREIHFGRWEGLTRDEIAERDPELFPVWQRDLAALRLSGRRAAHRFPGPHRPRPRPAANERCVPRPRRGPQGRRPDAARPRQRRDPREPRARAGRSHPCPRAMPKVVGDGETSSSGFLAPARIEPQRRSPAAAPCGRGSSHHALRQHRICHLDEAAAIARPADSSRTRLRARTRRSARGCSA